MPPPVPPASTGYIPCGPSEYTTDHRSNAEIQWQTDLDCEKKKTEKKREGGEENKKKRCRNLPGARKRAHKNTSTRVDVGDTIPSVT